MAEWTTQLPQFAQALIMLALAGLLIILGPNKRPNRVFAWILLLRSLAVFFYSFGLIATTMEDARTWWTWRPIPFFFLPFAVLHFLLIYPAPRGGLGRARSTGALLFAAGAILSGVYLADPSTFWDLDRYSGSALGPEVDAPAGPLFVFDVLFEVTYGLAALLFARDYLQSAPGPRRSSLLLVSLGFALVVLYDAVSLPLRAPDLLLRHGTALDAAMVGSLVVAAACVVAAGLWIGRGLRRERDARHRRGMTLYLLAMPLPGLSVLFLLWLPRALSGAPVTEQTLYYLFSGAWRLALPLFVMYALLRHRLFGIDLTLKWTLGRGTVALLLLAAVAGVTEAAVNALDNVPYGLGVGGLVAAAAVLLLRPIQRLAERVSDAAMPNVQRTDEYRTYRKFEIYRAALESALGDESITERERRVLGSLRQELGISESDARRLEQDLVGRRRSVG